jgi:hypothetical protein
MVLEVELEFVIKVNGNKILPAKLYKVSDGNHADDDFCEIVQKMREKLNKKMEMKINEVCS